MINPLRKLGEMGTKALAHGLENTESRGAKAVLSTLSTGVKAVSQLQDGLQRAFYSGEDLLRTYKLDPLVDQMREADRRAYLRAGKDIDSVHEALSPFRTGKKHNSDDLAHIVDVIEMAAKPKTEAHAKAAERISSILEAYGDEAAAAELPVFSTAKYHVIRDAYLKKGMDAFEADRLAKQASAKKFVKRAGYFPHYFDELTIAKYLAGGKTTDDAVARILAQGLADNREEAMNLLKRMLRAPAEFRGGPLAYVRDADGFLTDYDKDPIAVLTRYAVASARRLEAARTFGVDDKIALEQINKLGSVSHQKNALSLYRAWNGDTDPSYKDLARMTSTFHALTMLSSSGIVQPAQLMNTVARTGWGNTLKAMASVAKDWRKEKLWAGSTGAIFDTSYKDLMPDSFGGISEMWTRMIGLEKLDRFNRVVSSVAGRFWAQEAVGKLLGGQMGKAEMATAAHTLQQMGIDLKRVAANGGKLGLEDLRKAGLYMSSNTQFASGVLDLPELRNSPQGRFIYLFKSFAFQQTNFIQKEILKPAMHGDYRPFLAWGSAAGLSAPLVGEAVRTLKNREAPDDMKLRVIEDLAYVGSFGMFYDSFRAMSGGPGSIFNWALGPTAGEAAQFIGSDLTPMAEGIIKGEGPNFEPLVRHVASRVPGVGQWLRGAMDD